MKLSHDKCILNDNVIKYCQRIYRKRGNLELVNYIKSLFHQDENVVKLVNRYKNEHRGTEGTFWRLMNYLGLTDYLTLM